MIEKTFSIDQRSRQCRRQNHPPFFKFALVEGRRNSLRRADDRKRITVLDQYHTSLLIFVLIVLCLSLVDAALTLTLLKQGAVELNPVMRYYITLGNGAFVIAKYGLTALPLMFMVVANPIYPPRSRIGSFMFLFCGVAFGSVIIWELYLLGHIS